MPQGSKTEFVYQGDAIATGADGAVGIIFADGTVFNLSSDARAVLNEFAYDPNGSSNSALLSLAQGKFAFIAGKAAKTGGLRIDTPFASIRGSARDRGVGVLTLAALTFAAIEESQAASRHDAFLDDGTITYKDLPHGTFEIVTRDGRVIMSDDPGETIVVDPTGAVTRIPNSSSRMAELQQAQHSALATFSLGQEGGAAGGSSSPGFDIPVQLQPINFSQPRNDAPTEIVTTHITAASAGFIPVPQQLNPPPPVVTPVLGSAGFSMVTETVNTTGSTHVDTVSSGTLTFTDFEVTTVSATIASMTWSGGATPPSGLAEVLAGALSITTESANPFSGSIATTFSAADRNFDFLAANETLTIVYDVTVTDNQGVSLTRPVTITIIGTNDAPVLAADASGPHTVTEGLNTTGTFVFTDVDLTDHHTVSTSVTSATWSGGATLPSGVAAALAGALSATASDGTGPGSGSVAVTFSAADSAFDFLAAGQTLTLTYNVTVTDNNGVSSSQPVTFTITGTNDAPTLEPVTGPTYTDTPVPDHFNAVAGTLVGADVDLPQTLTYGIVGGTADNALNGYNVSLTGTYGKLYVNSASGAYTLVPNDATINALTVPTTENFIFTVSDGSLSAQQNFTVTINSAAAPTVSISDGTPNPATEGTDPSISFTVTLSEPADQHTLVTYSTVNGSAVAGSDFIGATNATITIPAGVTTATITIPVVDDAIVESPEAFTVVLSAAQLSGSNGALIITEATGAATITDNDGSALRLDGPLTVAEGDPTSNYTVSLTNGVGLGAGQSVTFTLDSASGTATEGTDFSALLAGGLTAAAGIVLTTSTGAGGVINVTATNTTAADLATGAALLSFTIATTQDSVVEGPENFTVTLASAAAVVNPTITTSITDDDLRAIRLDGPASVAEGAATGPYTVSLSGVGLGAGQSVTFTLDSASGTATEGTDFSALTVAGLTPAAGIVLSNFTTDPNGTIHVTATNTTAADLATGAALLSFTIATTQDSVVEGPENFTVTLASAAAVVNPTITTSITDDDLRGIRLDGPASVAEGAATGPYTVSLSGVGLGAGQSVTFTLDSASGTATEGTDFSALLAGGLTAAAGIVLTTSTGAGGVINVTATNTTAADLATGAALLSFTIATTQDSVVEGPENFTVTLASAAAVVNPTITTSITDDDLRGIRLDGPASVAEGAATGPYTVSLSGVGLGAGQSVTFTLDSASGTATEGTDFSALLAGGLTPAAGIVLSNFTTDPNGTIHVTATNTTAADLATGAALLSFTIATTQDFVVEGPENFTVTLASATAVVNPTITTSITDDDLRAIRLDGPGSVAEGAATGPYTVSLSGVGLGAGQSVTFTLDSASGTATEGTDFSALLAGGLTAAAGIVLTTSTGAGGVINVTATNTTAADLATGAALLSFTIATTQDSVVEGPENFTVTLASAAAVVNPTITTSITDDDLRAIRLDGPASVAEGAATGPYTVSLSGVGLGAGQSVTFTLDSASGTATEGTDFSALTVAGLTPAAGIVLSNFTTDPNGTIHVTATNTTAADLATGAALLSFTIATTQDSVVEGPENFTVTLASAAAVVNPTITTSITDDDLRAIRLDGPGSVAEGAATGPYTVSLSGVGLGAGQSVTFTLDSASGTATEGTDFSALLAGGLTAAAGIVLTTSTGAGGVINVTATNTTAADLATGAALLSFTIATTQDSVVEGPENFTVTLASAAAVVNPTITTSITDDDLRAIRLDGPASVAEGAATGPYTVSLSGVGLGAGQSVTFTLDSASGTATEGTDFSALLAGGLTPAAGIVLSNFTTDPNGTIHVTATNTTAADLATGAALLSFTIATTQDSVVEGPENFTVTLASAAAVVNPTITTSITDDDLRAIRLDGPGSVAEGAATGPYTVSLSGVGLGAGQSVTFTLDSASGTATEGTDFSALLAGGLTAAAGIVLTTSTGAGGVINVTATNTTAADLATGAALLSFTIATTPDSAIEGTENFTVTLASAAAVVNPTITTSITDVAPFALDLPDLGSLQGNGLNKNTEMGTFASGFTYSLGAGSSSGFVLSGTGNAVLSTGNENIVSGTYTLNVIATDQFGISHTTVVKIWVGTPNNDTIDLATLGNSSGINLAYGLNGVDKITGGGALDFLIGGQQPNTLTAGSGSEVFAASGNDTIVLNGLSFSDDIIYQLTPTDQIDLTSLLFVPGSMSATGSFNGTTTSLVVSNGTTSVTLNLGGDYSSSTWQFAKDAGTGTIFHDPPADSGTATINSGASPASVLTTATDSVSSVSGTNQVIGTDPNDLLLLSSPFTAANDSGDGQTADGTVAALNTAVSDPAGGETTNVTVNGDGAVAHTARIVSGPGSLMVNPGTAREFPSISHRVAGNPSDNRTVEVSNAPELGRTAPSRDRSAVNGLEGQIAIASVMLVLEYLTENFKLASDANAGTLIADPPASPDATVAAVADTRTVKAADTADTQATPVAADEGAVAAHDVAITPDGGMSDLTISGLPSDFALTENEGDEPTATHDAISLAYSEFTDHGQHGSGKDHTTAANVATTHSAEGQTAAKASVSMSSHTTSSETGSDGNSNGGDAARIHDAIAGHSSTIDTVGTTISDSVSSGLRGATSGHLNDQPHFENATPGTLQSLESPTQAALHAADIPSVAAVEDANGGHAVHSHDVAAEHSFDIPATTIAESDAPGARGEPPGHVNDQPQLGNADPGNNGLGHQSRELPNQAASQAAKDSPPVTAGEDANGGHAAHTHGTAAKDASTIDIADATVADNDSPGFRGEGRGHLNDQPQSGNADPGNNGLGHQSRELPSQASAQAAKDVPVEDAKGGHAAHTHGAAAKDSSTIDTPAPVIAESDAPGARGEPPGHGNDKPQLGNADLGNNGLGHQPSELPNQAASHAAKDSPAVSAGEDAKGDHAAHTHGAAAKDSSTTDTPATTIAESDAPGLRGEPPGHGNDKSQLGNADPGNNGLGHQPSELSSQAAAAGDIPPVVAVEDAKGGHATHTDGAAAKNSSTFDTPATTVAESDAAGVRGEPPGHGNDKSQLADADPGNNGLGHQSRESPSQASVQTAKDIPPVTAVENAKGDDAAHTHGAAAKNSSTIDTAGTAVAHTDSSGSQGAAAEDMSDPFHFANTNPGTSQSTELPSHADAQLAGEIPVSTTDNSAIGHADDFNAAALPNAVEDAKGSDMAQIRGAAAKDLSTTDVAGATVVGHNNSSSFQGALSGEMNDQFHFANANPGNNGLGQQSLELASQTTSHAAVDIPAATTELGQIVDDVLTQAAQAALDPGTTPDHNSQLPWTNTDQHNRSSDFITHA